MKLNLNEIYQFQQKDECKEHFKVIQKLRKEIK